ncbi:hypothetical protein ABW21_db0208348 [Orbilia brochopaga]|nr:hypothetical protein ABW21_db0208348 [Drechslerella brochopaga]
MIRRTILSHARTRPFSSLTAAARSSSSPLSIPPTSYTAPRLPQRSQTAFKWQNAARWSSTEASTDKPAESAPQPDAAAKQEVPKAAEPATADKCQKELEAKAKEVADLKDKYLRAVADFRNLQERTTREVKSAKDFAIQKFAKDLLESIDNLDRALTAQPTASTDPAKELQNLYDGLKMTEKVLMGTLEKHGLVRFNPVGEKFNPNLHEATFEAALEGKEPGTVFHVQTKGYQLNGRVLRAAQVGIVKAP